MLCVPPGYGYFTFTPCTATTPTVTAQCSLPPDDNEYVQVSSDQDAEVVVLVGWDGAGSPGRLTPPPIPFLQVACVPGTAFIAGSNTMLGSCATFCNMSMATCGTNSTVSIYCYVPPTCMTHSMTTTITTMTTRRFGR